MSCGTLMGICQAVVIAIAKDRGPSTIGHADDRWLTECETQITGCGTRILVIRIGKFPQDKLGGVALTERGWIGDIQGKIALPAGTQSTHSHSAPLFCPVDI